MPDIGNLGNLGSSAAAGYAAGIRQTGDAAARRMSDTAAAPAARAGDRVEVSEVARWLEEMNRLPAIREDKVAAAKAAIARGDYDNDEKLSIAVGRMIDEASQM
jgi:anti-sigma28 factor (negative regulator of flagellin synthesis)